MTIREQSKPINQALTRHLLGHFILSPSRVLSSHSDIHNCLSQSSINDLNSSFDFCSIVLKLGEQAITHIKKGTSDLPPVKSNVGGVCPLSCNPDWNGKEALKVQCIQILCYQDL